MYTTKDKILYTKRLLDIYISDTKQAYKSKNKKKEIENLLMVCRLKKYINSLEDFVTKFG